LASAAVWTSEAPVLFSAASSTCRPGAALRIYRVSRALLR
jgi:hypothetical protein